MSTEKASGFGRLGFSSLLSSDLDIISSDAPVITHKLLSKSKVRLALRLSASDLRRAEHYFTYYGVKYRAVFVPVFTSGFLCRIYPQDECLKRCGSEIYHKLWTIRQNSAGIRDGLSEVRQMMSDGRNGDIGDALNECVRLSGKLLDESDEVCGLFGSEGYVEYVMITERLERSCGFIERCCRPLDRKLSFSINISRKVARVDYQMFEYALFSACEICASLLPPGETANVGIRGRSSGELGVSVHFPTDDKFIQPGVLRQMKLACCAFEYLGGRAEFVPRGSRMSFRAAVPVNLSDQVSRVRTSFPDNEEELLPQNGINSIAEAREETARAVAERKEPLLKSPAMAVSIFDISGALADLMFSVLYEIK